MGKLSQELSDYFRNTSRKQVKKDWEKSNCKFGITIEEFINNNMKRRVSNDVPIESQYKTLLNAHKKLLAKNSYLKSQDTDLCYSLLQKIEGKIYKYAKVDYDKEFSIDVLRILYSILEIDKMLEIDTYVNDFIDKNDKKMKNIFDENRFRYHEISFLTQPEIFVIWYALENFEYTLIDNWDSYFDSSDLEQIQTLWGKIID